MDVVMRFPLRVGMTKEGTDCREADGTDQDECVESEPDRAKRAAAVLPTQGDEAQHEAGEGQGEENTDDDADEAEHGQMLLWIDRGDDQRRESDAGEDDQAGNERDDERGDAVTR